MKLRGIESALLVGRQWTHLESCLAIRQRLGWASGVRTKPENGWYPTGLEAPDAAEWARDVADASDHEKFYWLERYYRRRHRVYRAQRPHTRG